jgi:hypothetical protein
MLGTLAGLGKPDAPGIWGLHFIDVAAPPAIVVVVFGDLPRLVPVCC